MTDDTLRTAQLIPLWGVKERSVRYILSELENFGAVLEIDYYGARKVPAPLAHAVAAARKEGRGLETLVNDSELRRFFRRGPDTLAELIELRAEAAIQREMLGALWGSLQKGISRPTPNISWGHLALPDPRGAL
jgi:hypothetical protein